MRAKYAYVTLLRLQNTLFQVATSSQMAVTKLNVKNLVAIKLLKQLQSSIATNTAMKDLIYFPIMQDLVEVVICIGATFAMDSDKSSQPGSLGSLQNKTGGLFIIPHYTSTKRRCIRKSVLAAVHFSFVNGFGIGFTIAHSLIELATGKDRFTM